MPKTRRKQFKLCIMPLGQTPRDDWAGPLQEIVGDSVEIVQRGCLDGLTCQEILDLDRRADDHMMMTALPALGGKRVTFAKRHVLDRIQSHLNRLEKEGVDAVAMCCSEKWPTSYEFDGHWIEVFSIMHDMVTGMGYEGRGVIFYHVESQRQATVDRWTDVDDLSFVYLADDRSEDEHESIMQELEEAGVTYAVLDCFGFSRDLKNEILARLGIPVYLPLTCLGNAVREAYASC